MIRIFLCSMSSYPRKSFSRSKLAKPGLPEFHDQSQESWWRRQKLGRDDAELHPALLPATLHTLSHPTPCHLPLLSIFSVADRETPTPEEVHCNIINNNKGEKYLLYYPFPYSCCYLCKTLFLLLFMVFMDLSLTYFSIYLSFSYLPSKK